jgi:hypothetical protein
VVLLSQQHSLLLGSTAVVKMEVDLVGWRSKWFFSYCQSRTRDVDKMVGTAVVSADTAAASKCTSLPFTKFLWPLLFFLGSLLFRQLSIPLTLSPQLMFRTTLISFGLCKTLVRFQLFPSLSVFSLLQA